MYSALGCEKLKLFLVFTKMIMKMILLFFVLDFQFGINIVFLVLGFLHGVRGEFTDDVSENAVSPIFTGQELEGK
jgi:hypothetical protein